MATKLGTSVRRYSDQVPEHLVVAAIDFGTSSCGYAIGFPESGNIELSDIILNKWHLSHASSSTDKAPTTVLLNPDKSFNSFGYKAEDKYAHLCDKKCQEGWWYFQKFKMMLYKSKLSREVMLHDADNKPLQAKYVFSIVISHLKSCILEDIRKQNKSIKDDDILYVLTVPAIWSDAAKQFMREAATDQSVGIPDNQLKLVLEPEAASVFCRTRTSRVVRDSDGASRLDSLEIGHKYIIFDLGGGTADIATHEIIENDQLHEIDYARGDDLGGQQFDECFLQFLNDLFGEDTFKEWRLSKHADYLRLLRDIEGIKWKIKTPHNNDDGIYFEVPRSLVQRVEKKTGILVGETLSPSRFSSEVKHIKKTKFLLKNDFVRSFFRTILTGVKQHFIDICRNESGIKTAFIVGGLAKSDYVLKNIRTMFPQYTFIVPEDPGVAVLKGAVLLGNKPQTIAGRIARYSYGIGVAEVFVVGKHDIKHWFTRDGECLCDNVFKKLIEKGQVLKYGDTFTTPTIIKAKMSETKQIVFNTCLYQSTKTPSYCTEAGCTKLGGMEEYPPKGGWPDMTDSEVKIIVGEAEFKFYINDSLGREYETTLDFLAQN